MRGSFNRENNELAIELLNLRSQLAKAHAQNAQDAFQLALKDQTIDDLNSKLEERRVSPPPSRKRDREEGEFRERYSEYEHSTDIYIEGWNKSGVNFEPFKEFVKEKYGIEVLKVTGVGKDQFFSRFHLKSNEDQNTFINNVDGIREDFGLKGVIKIFRERKYN